MSLFRKDPTEAELAAVNERIIQRMEAKAKERAATAEAEAEEAAKNRPALDQLMPRVTFGDRLTESQVESFAESYRARYTARYDGDDEIQELMEARLVAALIADGYSVPKKPEQDRLKILRARHAAKGKN
jgi:hypothetical protein